MNSITLGDKFFKKEGDGIFKIIRVVKFKNKETLSVEYNNKRYSIKKDKLIKEYKRLKPNGYISFNIVSVCDNKDVIVTMSRRKDLEQGERVPYCTCRQNINNIFSSILNYEKVLLGLSLNKDNTPVDTEYTTILACDKVLKTETVSYYINDSIDKILSFIKHDEYNKVLSEIALNFKDTEVYGISKDLNSLLKDNGFIDDIHYGFGIIRIKDIIEIDDDDHVKNLDIIKELEKKLNITIYNHYILKFDNTIDISKIKRKYIMIYDKSDTLYILAFDTRNLNNKNIELERMYDNVRRATEALKNSKNNTK